MLGQLNSLFLSTCETQLAIFINSNLSRSQTMNFTSCISFAECIGTNFEQGFTMPPQYILDNQCYKEEILQKNLRNQTFQIAAFLSTAMLHAGNLFKQLHRPQPHVHFKASTTLTESFHNEQPRFTIFFYFARTFALHTLSIISISLNTKCLERKMLNIYWHFPSAHVQVLYAF